MSGQGFSHGSNYRVPIYIEHAQWQLNLEASQASPLIYHSILTYSVKDLNKYIETEM